MLGYILAIIISGGIAGTAVFLIRQRQITRLSSDLQTERESRITAEQLNNRIPQLEQSLKEKEADIGNLISEATDLKANAATLNTKLEEQQKSYEQKEQLLKNAEERLTTTFKALSSDALKESNNQFLQLAKTKFDNYQTAAKTDLDARQKAIQDLVKPLSDSIAGVDKTISEIEKQRIDSFSALTTKIAALAISEADLKKETSNLVDALRRPSVRGRWGEMQLRRVVELAGMVNYCDFVEQQSSMSERGLLRPDLIVKLPNEKNIVIDAKTILDAYIQAIDMADPEQRLQKLKEHAGQVKTHITKLSAKAYWDQFPQAPEFVVMFLPGEMFFSAALEHDPTLIEMGAEKKVIVASPTTLIALLQAVYYGWKQAQIAKNAVAISDLGKQLYERLRTLGNYVTNVGNSLEKALGAYNQAVASFEGRVLVTARKFKEMGAASGDDIDIIEPIDTLPRQIQAPDLL